MFLGHLHAVGVGGQAWLSKTFNTRKSLIPVIGSTMIGLREKIFKANALRRLENVILKLGFVNILLHKRAISLFF